MQIHFSFKRSSLIFQYQVSQAAVTNTGKPLQLREGNKLIIQRCASITEVQWMLNRILLAVTMFIKIFTINYEQNAILPLLVVLFIDFFLEHTIKIFSEKHQFWAYHIINYKETVISPEKAVNL